MDVRTKLLRGGGDTTVLLVYPSTAAQYRESLAAIGGASGSGGGCTGPPAAERGPGHASFVVTTARQRQLWGLPDLAASVAAAVVDEGRAMGLLHDAAADPDDLPGAFLPGSADRASSAASRASALADARGLLAPGASRRRVARALARSGLPADVRGPLAEDVARAFKAGPDAVRAEIARLRLVLDLPWAKAGPQHFDCDAVAEELNRGHAALDGANAAVLRFLGSVPEARGLLTFEGPRPRRRAEPGAPPALVVRPGAVRTSG